MEINRKIFLILIVIIFSAFMLQIFKLGFLDRLFSLKQDLNEEKVNYLSSDIPEKSKRILVLYGEGDQGSIDLYNNITHTFDMTKTNYEMIKINDMEVENKIKSLAKEDLIVVATEKIYEMSSEKLLIQFVENGGKIVFLVRFVDSRFDELVGVIENKGFSNEDLFGFHFEKPLFPGLDEIELKSKKIVHSFLKLSLNEQVEILATAENIPIIWTHKLGEGEILYTNSTLFMDKANRGVMLQYISYVDDYFIATIFNGKIVDIDDFPAPIKKGKDEIIYSHYNMKNRQFYRHIWWSAMHNIASKYNLKYTGLVIGTYTDSIKEPLDKPKVEELEDVQYFGRKLSEVHGELGIHGYNHNSLALKDQMNFEEYHYNPWESQKTMEKGLRILRKSLESIYGDIPIYTYVPPSNIISKEGKQAVKNVFPEVKIFAGIYTGMPVKGVLYQEFGKDDDFKNVYKFPRISAGYHYQDDMMWDIYNGIAHYGMINHFIHPDDILDEERSKGNTWKELEENISKIFSETYKHYAFLRPMTNVEACEEYIDKERLKVYTKKENKVIHIYYENLIPPAYHFLRLKDDKIIEAKGGEFSVLDKETGLYLIIGKKEKVEILLK